MNHPSKPDGLYVQYGCGFSAPEGWLNFDASPTVRIGRIPVIGKALLRMFHPVFFPPAVRYGDIVKGLPVPEGSVQGLYCSHVLEHLSLNDFRTALLQSRRLLKSGGTFRLVMPDLQALAETYFQHRSEGNPDASLIFIRNSLMGTVQRPKGLLRQIRFSMGNEHHLWLWDHESTMLELKKAGFTQIRRCSYHDSDDTMFQRVEAADRFTLAVAIECKA